MKRGNRGLTLVEVMIATAILGAITLAIFLLIHRGSSTYAVASRHAAMQQKARIVLDRIAEELRVANPVNVVAATDPNAPIQLQYQVAENYKTIAELQAENPTAEITTGVTEWSPMVTITYEASPVDANNNGLADDWRLCRTQFDPDANGGAGADVKVTLCDFVAAGGLVLSRGGNRITLQLTLVMRGEKNEEMSATVTTSVMIRNIRQS